MGTESGRAAVLLRQARTLNLQTGNLLNWGRLRKKCPATPSEEVSLKKRWGVFVCMWGDGDGDEGASRDAFPTRRWTKVDAGLRGMTFVFSPSFE